MSDKNLRTFISTALDAANATAETPEDAQAQIEIIQTNLLNALALIDDEGTEPTPPPVS